MRAPFGGLASADHAGSAYGGVNGARGAGLLAVLAVDWRDAALKETVSDVRQDEDQHQALWAELAAEIETASGQGELDHSILFADGHGPRWKGPLAERSRTGLRECKPK